MNRDFLYNEIANGIARQITGGLLKAGDKLPSVRTLCREYSISMNTAKRVFLELEAQSLIDSKPQSGYFVSMGSHLKLPLPEVSRPSSVANSMEPDELISKVYANMGNDDFTLFSIGVPSPDLFPLAKLRKEIITATRELNGGGIAYEPLQGNVNCGE
jgi:DNA-binding transcriptional MocR family regulator